MKSGWLFVIFALLLLALDGCSLLDDRLSPERQCALAGDAANAAVLAQAVICAEKPDASACERATQAVLVTALARDMACAPLVPPAPAAPEVVP